MSLSTKMNKAINRQLNRELWSAYLYLSMAAYFDSEGLPGFAGWMKAQAREETSHALKFYSYLASKDSRVEMQELETPPGEWDSPVSVFEHTLDHEKKVTGLINDLVSLAGEESDEDTLTMLDWFVKEQEEEEKSAGEVLGKVTAAAGDLSALDQELGQRD